MVEWDWALALKRVLNVHKNFLEDLGKCCVEKILLRTTLRSHLGGFGFEVTL
jgi:hypothetical protein